jgi:hypothetical protein
MNLKKFNNMKNRKKLAKGVVALSMVLSFGGAILAPTHEAVASAGCTGCKQVWCQKTQSYKGCDQYGNGMSCLTEKSCS